LYKTLPVPNGGVLVANDNPSPAGLSAHSCAASSVTGPMSELVLRWIRTQYEIPGQALFAMKRETGRLLTALRIRRMPVGNSGFDLSAVNIGMSPICHRLLPHLRYDWIKEVRRRNFAILTERLSGYIPLLEKDLAPGVCPLFFPLLVKDKKG